MNPIKDLRDLFVEQLRDRYDAETQKSEAFLKLHAKAQSTALKQAVSMCVSHAKDHAKKVERLLNTLHEDPVGEICEGTVGLINEAWELLARCIDREISDAAIITSIQHIHHHGIAGYGTLCAFANAMRMEEAARVLHDILDDEKGLDRLLSELAADSINNRAVHPMSLNI